MNLNYIGAGTILVSVVLAVCNNYYLLPKKYISNEIFGLATLIGFILLLIEQNKKY